MRAWRIEKEMYIRLYGALYYLVPHYNKSDKCKHDFIGIGRFCTKCRRFSDEVKGDK